MVLLLKLTPQTSINKFIFMIWSVYSLKIFITEIIDTCSERLVIFQIPPPCLRIHQTMFNLFDSMKSNFLYSKNMGYTWILLTLKRNIE